MTCLRISKDVKDLPMSGIRAFFDLVLEQQDIVSLGVGEPDFVTPWHVREIGINSLKDGLTSYTSNKGITELRVAIARYLKNLIGVDYDPAEEILITVGVSQGLDLTMRGLLDPGDEVIYFEPCYVSYGPMIKLAGGVPVPVELSEAGFQPNIEAVKNAITDKTRAILICSPNNPTGTVFKKEDLAALAELCLEKDLVAISDEIYAELVYDEEHVSIASLGDISKQTVLLGGVSKAQAMTGWRIGYACGPKVLIDGLLKIHQYSMLCAPITGQIAAVEALDNGAETTVATRKEYSKRRKFIIDSLNDMGLGCHTPGGAFYAFPSIEKTGLNAVDFCLRLLKEKKVAVVPGSAFGLGGEGHIRCAYAASMDKIQAAMPLMAEFVKGL